MSMRWYQQGLEWNRQNKHPRALTQRLLIFLGAPFNSLRPAGSPWFPLWELILELQSTVGLSKQLTGSTSLKCSPAYFLMSTYGLQIIFRGCFVWCLRSISQKSSTVVTLRGYNAHYTLANKFGWIKNRQLCYSWIATRQEKKSHFAALEESHVVTNIKGVVLCAVAIFDCEVEVQVERQIQEVKRLE